MGQQQLDASTDSNELTWAIESLNKENEMQENMVTDLLEYCARYDAMLQRLLDYSKSLEDTLKLLGEDNECTK